MSLMNDALRKKRAENKHPSGADFLKTDPEPKSKKNYRFYSLVIIGMLICVLGGYFGYEYYSLSRPISPPQSSELIATSSPAAQAEPMATQESRPQPTPVEPEAPVKQEAETLVASVETETQAPTPVEAETPIVAEPASQKKEPPQPPAAKPMPITASQQTQITPRPVVEPEGVMPAAQKTQQTQPNPAQKDLKSPENQAQAIAERFYRKGLSYHRQNNLDKAIQMYLAAHEQDPQHTATSFNLASAYIQVGAFAEAHTILSDLNRQEPDNPEILLNMAVVELGLDRPEQALRFLDRAEKGFSGPRYEVLFHQGAAHSRLGNFIEALTVYQRAEMLAPRKSRLSLNIAIAHDNLKQYNRAIEYYLMFLDQYEATRNTERREIENRVRELRTYLARQKGASTE